ncbi:MAG: murein L,D-transpeptidase [Alphaproteobacteria bacterium]
MNGLLNFLAAIGLLLAVLPLTSRPAYSQAVSPEQQIKQLLDRVLTSEGAQVRGETIADPAALLSFYAERDFKPLWRNPGRYHAMVAQLNNAARHGLTPAHYHADALRPGMASQADWTAEDEVLATDGLKQLLRNLRFGRVDPVSLDPRWNIARPADREYGLEQLRALESVDDLVDTIRTAAPQHFFYDGLMTVLARYRDLSENVASTLVPAGAALKPDMTDPRVTLLRQRLEATDEVGPADPDAADRYNEALVEAVKRFQVRHGLDADGVVGPETLRALNVSFEDRVQQIRVNLERARWVLHDLSDEFLVVNIAGFEVFLVRGGSPVWNSRVVVGRTYRKTPVFKAEMSYLVLNPTWTIPPTILRKDKLPAIAKDVSYLAKNNMQIVDRTGRAVDPATIDWTQTTARGFPYQIVQRPGPDNALGQIKFMFPNDHFVYLHDTPSRELFGKASRAFSSGCVRVENPLDLAERLLAGQEDWTRETIEKAIATGRLRNVTLTKKMPIIIMYWTVQPSPAVGVRFFRDVYERDAAVLAALNANR